MVAPKFSFLFIVVVALAINSIAGFLLNLEQFNSESEYIVGGELARTGQFPHQVRLVNLERRHGFCGGSIISDRWIVTAAHCTQGQSANTSVIGVLVGATNVSSTGRIVRLSRVVNHPEYRGYDLKLKFDISLLQTERQLEFSDTIQAIPLNRRHIDGGVRGIVSGWGTTEDGVQATDLRYLHVYTLENEQCRETDDGDEWIHDSTLCVFHRLGTGHCFGDSGGPLITGGGLVGIVSWVQQCAASYPDGFTRVSSFVDWIEEVTGLGTVDI